MTTDTPSPPQPPRGLIFDCDGTLADTMPLHWEAWSEIARRHGLNFPRDRFFALAGVPSRHILRILSEEQGVPLDPVEVAHEKEETYLEKLSHVGPIHAVYEIARENRGRLPMAVASGGTKKVILQVLDHLKIRDWFQAVVTSEDIEHQKPAPDIFLEAARQIGVSPQFCRAYEDSDLGMQAIRAAGMQAVDVREMTA